MGMNDDYEYANRKLAHYNKWLLDPKRELGTFYPGFPEDIQRERAVAKLKAEAVAKVVTKAEKPKMVRPAKVKRTRKVSDGPTKLEQAIELYKANTQLSKDSMIALIRERLDMSLAGATTYYYNAKKA